MLKELTTSLLQRRISMNWKRPGSSPVFLWIRKGLNIEFDKKTCNSVSRNGKQKQFPCSKTINYNGVIITRSIHIDLKNIFRSVNKKTGSVHITSAVYTLHILCTVWVLNCMVVVSRPTTQVKNQESITAWAKYDISIFVKFITDLR